MIQSGNQTNSTELDLIENKQAVISISDVVLFLSKSWKKLLIAAFFGAAFGFGSWYFFASYKADLILLNNGSKADLTSTNNISLDLISWRLLQKSLPNLADQILEEKKIPQENISIYRQMSANDWWQKNVTASYAISKSDAKDLASISKELDGASTQILSINITSDAATHEKAVQNVRNAGQFLLTGGAYLQVRSLFNAYEVEALGADADVQKKINATEIELSYLQERLKSLEGLLKRFPADQKVAQQVVDPKDSGAKYLPISTQIIAVNTDINSNYETLERLKDRISQIKMLKAFLEGASPLIEKHFDGILLTQELLTLEDKLRNQLQVNDLKSQLFLDQLRSRLLNIQVRFTKGLEANTAPNVKKVGMTKAIVSGFFLGLFLVLICLLASHYLPSVSLLKRQQHL